MENTFQFSLAGRRRLFPFRKRSLPLLTVGAIIGNQAFVREDVIVCSGLCYNKAISNFFKPRSLQKAYFFVITNKTFISS